MLKPNEILRNDEPGEAGGGTAPAAIETTAPAAVESTAPTQEPKAEEFGGLKDALDAVGTEPKPNTQPRVAGKFAATSQVAAGVAATPTPPTPTAAPVAAKTPATPTPTPAPKPGEIDLTPPEGMAPRTQERWQQLTERAKLAPVLEQRLTEATTALDSVRRMVSESGLAPQEFTGFLQMGRDFKSDNPQDMQRALQHLDGLRANLATRLGVEVPGVDLLAKHADLQADVDGMLMTRERALEIARHREQSAQTGATLQQQREHSQFVNTVNSAAAQIGQVLEQKAGTPGHEAKMAYVANYFKDPARMQQFVSTYQPQQWGAVVLTMYDAFTPPAATPAGPQPLRPNNVRAGNPVRTGPVTAEAAVMGAFDRLGL